MLCKKEVFRHAYMFVLIKDLINTPSDTHLESHFLLSNFTLRLALCFILSALISSAITFSIFPFQWGLSSCINLSVGLFLQKFLDSSKLKRHFLTHTGERDYVCPHEGCGRVPICHPLCFIILVTVFLLRSPR